MTITLTFPAGTKWANFGRAAFPLDGNPIVVPDFVAVAFSTITGVTAAPAFPKGTVASLLAKSQDHEAGYLLRAYGMPIPAKDVVAAAQAMFATIGTPAVSVS